MMELHVTRPRASQWGAWQTALMIVLGLVGLLYLVAGVWTPLNRIDEGFILAGAARILAGDVPHRDFWTIYPAGQLWLTAATFALVGPSVLWARLVDTAIRLALVVAVYLLARAVARPALAAVPTTMTLISLGALGFYGYAVLPALTLVFLAVRCLFAYLDTARLCWAIGAGTLLGTAALFRHDIAAYAAGATVIAVLLAQPLGADKLGVRTTLRVLGTILLSAVGLFLAAMLPLLLTVPLSDLWTQLIVFPASALKGARWLPYPGLIPEPGSLLFGWVKFYAPLTIFAATIIWGMRVRQVGRWGWRIVYLVALGLVLFLQALSRYDWVHVFPATIPAAIVLAAALPTLFRSGRGRPASVVLVVVCLMLFAFSYLVMPVQRRVGEFLSAPPTGCGSHLPRAGCLSVPPEYEAAVAYVQAHTAASEPIFVGSSRHDKLLANDVMFLFLAGRPPGTRYHELYPGLATMLSVQRTIIADLERSGVRIVVTSTLGQDWYEPNSSAISSGVTELDEFIRHAYRSDAQFGDLTIWIRH